MKTVLHIITGLGPGGAENTLFKMVQKEKVYYKHFVLSLTDGGFYERALLESGITVISLKMPRGVITIKGILKLVKTIKKIKPTIIQTWMYHANIIAGIIGKILGFDNIVWGIHHTTLDPKICNKILLNIIKIGSILSHFIPKRVVYCSEEAMKVHNSNGYCRSKSILIENGYDTEVFKPNYEMRTDFRNEINIGQNIFIIGMVARWDPLKDYPNLINAMKLIWEKRKDIILVCVGEEINENNSSLFELIRRAYGVRQTILLGVRKDVPRIMNGIDLHVLSSCGEAFPNVIAEAMLSGTPCVATDVGDTKKIMGNYGWISAPHDFKGLAEKIFEAVDEIELKGKDILGLNCREQICKKYSIKDMVARYIQLWEHIEK